MRTCLRAAIRVFAIPKENVAFKSREYIIKTYCISYYFIFFPQYLQVLEILINFFFLFNLFRKIFSFTRRNLEDKSVPRAKRKRREHLPFTSEMGNARKDLIRMTRKVHASPAAVMYFSRKYTARGEQR